MASNLVHITRRGFGETTRKDLWWLPSLSTFIGFSAFIAYSTWAAFQGEHYRFGPYLSPFYSPELLGSATAWFGPKPGWIPSWIPFTAALMILWAPGGFRFTCYYYRGAYYKAFWADPPGCAVGEPRHSYRGERKFPLIIQNIHRYFLYLALIFILILAYDAYEAFHFSDGIHVGVGTIILCLNVVLLGSYTLGCHSLRHLVGGGCDTLSNKPVRFALWRWVSALNRRHMMFAWFSLFWVGFSDIYVRLCSMGIFTDYRIF
ncbi:MAG: succinate dehydrogenase [Acidobacteria bacterium]|nr:MAG: succinate dehydrogenase [Acidobacteriota bacterium]